MSGTVCRLIEAYRRELDLYDQVLALAKEAMDVVRDGRSLADLHAVNQKKKERLDEVAGIEVEIARDKETWRRGVRLDEPNAQLDALLAELSRRIEQILRVEEETDSWILRTSVQVS